MIFGSLASQELLKAVKSIGTIWVCSPTPSQYPEMTCSRSGSQVADPCTTEKMRITGSENFPG